MLRDIACYSADAHHLPAHLERSKADIQEHLPPALRPDTVSFFLHSAAAEQAVKPLHYCFMVFLPVQSTEASPNNLLRHVLQRRENGLVNKGDSAFGVRRQHDVLR